MSIMRKWLVAILVITVLSVMSGLALQASFADSGVEDEKVLDVVYIQARATDDYIEEVLYLRGTGAEAGQRARIPRHVPSDEHFEDDGLQHGVSPILPPGDRVKLSWDEEGELVFQRL